MAPPHDRRTTHATRHGWLGARERAAYFACIGYDGPAEPTLEALRAIHRAHLLAIPYENLDIHLGRPLVLDQDTNFRKLVVERRGGWCYEMNGVLGAVLESCGFDVTYLSGTVGRARWGDAAEGNHLVLLVQLEQPWVVDVGFGDGFLEPLPLVEGSYRQGIFDYALSRQDDRWTMHNHPWGGADEFDFTLAPRSLEDFRAQCLDLQTSPASGFVLTTVVQRFTPAGLVTMRGVVLKEITAAGVRETIVDEASAWSQVMHEHFGLEIPGVERLYPRVWARHLAWMEAQRAAADAPTLELPGE